MLHFLIFFYQSSFWVSKKKCRFVFGKISKNIFDSTPCFSFSCCQLFQYIFSCMIQRTLFYVFNLSFEKYLVSSSLRFCKKKSPQKILDSLDFFSILFLPNLFSFFFVSSLFVCSPCCYSSYSLFFSMFFSLFFLSMFLSFCLPSLSLLFFFFFFLHASSLFVCSLHVNLFSLMFLLFVFILIFRFFGSLLFIFRFLLLKNHSFLNWSSFFVKLFGSILFFFVSSPFLIVFSMVFFRTRSSLLFF